MQYVAKDAQVADRPPSALPAFAATTSTTRPVCSALSTVWPATSPIPPTYQLSPVYTAPRAPLFSPTFVSLAPTPTASVATSTSNFVCSAESLSAGTRPGGACPALEIAISAI